MTNRKLNLRAAIWAGIAAGAVFILLEMALLTFVQGMSPWGPPRMMAAIALGEGVLLTRGAKEPPSARHVRRWLP